MTPTCVVEPQRFSFEIAHYFVSMISDINLEIEVFGGNNNQNQLNEDSSFPPQSR